MSDVLPSPQTRVLSTLHQNGTRRWLFPRLSEGRFLRARRMLAYVLIAIFTILPHLRIAGKPVILLNLPRREFTLFGFTFLPTDTLLLALTLVTLIVGICLATALAGRLWCGWMCPQTVYLEFVFRPLERLFDGSPGARHRPGTKATPIRTGMKYALYLLISVYLAHTFLAYFVGVDALAQWVRRSPLEHPLPFLVMLAVTGLMMFDFSYFREQMCIVACPYGRFQSVMLDRDSLIVSYDPRRGEPRGKRKGADGPRGDCVDCGMCTDTCPTGIDIREGLQLECIGCTQCIDACDAMMTRIGKPRGLIRFSSQARIEGERGRLVRPRVIVYPAILLVLLTTLVRVLATKQSADVTLLRGLGAPFAVLPSGEVTNKVRLKIKNRGSVGAAYLVEIAGNVPARLNAEENPVRLAPGESRTVPILVEMPVDRFQNGKCDVTLRISDGQEFSRDFPWRLLGPG